MSRSEAEGGLTASKIDHFTEGGQAGQGEIALLLSRARFARTSVLASLAPAPRSISRLIDLNWFALISTFFLFRSLPLPCTLARPDPLQ